MRRTRSTTLCASLALLACAVGALAMGPGGNGKKDSQISLVRPEDPPDPNAKGTLRIREKGNGESFEVHVMSVNPNHALHVWLEDPIDSDTFTDIGTMPDSGSPKLKIDTKKGDALPLGAASISDLIGRKVEIRHDDDVVLKGVVPPWDLSKHPKKATLIITPPDGAPAPDMSAKLSLRAKDDKGQERIELKAKHVPWDSDLHLKVFVEDGVGSGVFVDSGDVDKKGGHEGHWKRDTKQGQALPAGANFDSELAGRLIEVRRASDDVVFLRGTIPMVE
jgi:hypothetical protein